MYKNLYSLLYLFCSGKYYHVDAGYPNMFGYLTPYKGERYHAPEFHRGVAPTYSQREVQ
jgi:hypothetical protein